MKRILLLFSFALLTVNFSYAQTLPSRSVVSKRAMTRNHRNHPVKMPQHATASPLVSRSAQAGAVPEYGLQGSVNLAPSSPQFTAVDPFANHPNPSDPLKPARPFWYSADKDGLTVLTIGGNVVVEHIPWNYVPAGSTTPGIPVVQPDGSFVNVVPPAQGYQIVGMTVSYPTEEALASNSETPPTYVYIVAANSGYEWQSNPAPPTGRDPNLRDTLVPSKSAATESAMLIQVDVTDPTLPLNDPAAPVAPLSAAILGHGAGQPAYDPGTGSVYVGNMPSTSLPTTPIDLTSFVSVIAGIAPPEVAAAGEAGGAEAPPIILPLESPDVLPNTPLAWPLLVEGGEGPYSWSFANLPSWLTAHVDKITHQLDGIVYGTVPATGSWTFQVQVTDLGADPPLASELTSITMTANPAAEEQLAGELPFEAGVPNAVAIQGTGSCAPGSTASVGSIVPAWIDVVTIPGGVNPAKPDEQTIGCVVMGTAPISGEYYEFTMPNFKFAYPWDREPVLLSGNVAGPYVFDPLPAGVGLSGLAWHEIDKIHDPSTEADILNAEFFGVDPFSGQLYQILLPQGALEVSGALAPPEISVESDQINAYAEVLSTLKTARADIASALTANPNLKVKFGNLAVEASRDPNVYVTAGEILDPTGADPTVVPIGGPTGSTISDGALVKVSGIRGVSDPAAISLSAMSAIGLPGVQAYYLGLDSDLSPAVRGSEPGQVDHGVLWATGTNTGNVGVVGTAAGTLSQTLAVDSAASLGGVSVDIGTGSSYVAAKLSQNVTIFGTGTSPTRVSPKIWSGITAVMGVGSAGAFTVIATGTPTPAVSYAGTLPVGVTFVDNGNGTATLAGTPAPGSERDYPLTFTASNGVLPNATQVFTLTVGTAPTITSAGTTTFAVGIAGSFTVTATGTPIATLSYTGTLPSGVTFADNEDGTATLAGTPAAGTTGSYPLTITATNGAPPDAIQNFVLIVSGTDAAPVITTHPTSQTVTVGQTATFTAAATGTPTPTVQWQYSTNGGTTWLNLAGATSTSYTTPATTRTMNGYQLRAVFTNSIGSASSNVATLTVNPSGTAPVITTQPTSQTVTAGQKATFTAAASGTPAPTVQWQYSTNGGTTWLNLAGATSTSYTTPATTRTMNGYQLRAVFANSVGKATSNAATLTVNAQ